MAPGKKQKKLKKKGSKDGPSGLVNKNHLVAFLAQIILIIVSDIFCNL